MLGANTTFAAAAITFALHEAEDITEEEGMTTDALGVFEVLAKEVALAVRVIEVNV